MKKMEIKNRLISFLFVVTLLTPVIVFGEGNAVTKTIDEIREWIVLVSTGLAILMYTVSGFLWMSDAGNAERVKMARSIMVSTTIGLIIILMAAAISSIVGDIVQVPAS
ncbi:MAG: hypothetical protein PHV29_01570 [Candidatus Pacebacteria bacterium]|nr:hypothetical protein [Candidatus Paceibacterota bacterium]MDD2757276.1 hypothetical protein [Candidatus Paceibacterota bacterium]MDD3283870.1 hypothetical protein [Candidatus Paceibacterota bacterium]MDD4737931.1 hypothetical protein [Candidatus Paceibacterota bacterium]